MNTFMQTMALLLPIKIERVFWDGDTLMLSPDFRSGTITRYQQYYDTQGNRLKYEAGEWKGWK
ncbi:hypothetical protein [Pseudomonas syringae]|uniref:hypothetical protein n=1 Tax=Pseudomonas syringae TaxID=317 RepID=UPI001CA81F10|nr:hypothetical protein [Pseudomonas syringae]